MLQKTYFNLNLNSFKLTIKFFKFQYFSNEEIAITMSNFGICYMYHITINIKVQLEYINFQLVINILFFNEVKR